MTASHPVFKPVTLPDFQNGNDTATCAQRATSFIAEIARAAPLQWR